MADIVLDASAVADVVTFVAPGFLAYTGYRLRFPGAAQDSGAVLIVSVVTSLPLVAAVQAAMPDAQKPTQLGYVAILLVLSLLVGYAAALLRGWKKSKVVLSWLGYRTEPEGSIYAQTLQHMSDEGTVTVEIKDGRRFSGCPRNGPQHKDDGIEELYLVYPIAYDADGNTTPINAAGVIVPLSEVSYMTLSEEPTGAAQASAVAEFIPVDAVITSADDQKLEASGSVTT